MQPTQKAAQLRDSARSNPLLIDALGFGDRHMHESWMSPKVKVRQSTVHGRGIVAVSAIACDEAILVWGGASYTDKGGALEALKKGRLVMQWDDDVFSREVEDVEGDDDPFLINHSCDPNAWMNDAYTICARRDIGPGEEITADYALWESDESHVSSWFCNCGSPRCRGRITGVDWKEPGLRERYRGHFSPLLNKRIERDGQ
jgi:uncharacterized protein